MARPIRLTQRRAMLKRARAKAQAEITRRLKPVFQQQFKRLERFLRRSNLRKKLNKIDLLEKRYKVVQQSEDWVVLNTDTGKMVPGGNHGSDRSRAMAHLRALYANVEDMQKGGQGSGNFGHKGRPGIVGGSGDDGYDYSRVNVVDRALTADKPTNYWILPSGKVLSQREKGDMHMSIAQRLFGLQDANSFEGYNRLLGSGALRIDNSSERTIIETENFDTGTFRHIQSMVDNDKLELGRIVEWSGTSKDGTTFREHFVRVPYAEFMDAKHVYFSSDGGKPFLKSQSQYRVQELLKQSNTSGTKEWEEWKKKLLLALLLGLFSAVDYLADVENEIWESRGYDNLTYDAASIVEDYQRRTGLPLTGIAEATLIAVERIIAGWYDSEEPFPELIHQLDRYFNDVRIETIAATETGNIIAQMVIQQMVASGDREWYWDAMGENPCHGELAIKGVIWKGCSELNGHLFPLGDPMPPDAAHPNCQCLPTPRSIHG
jgi:hypothetical protein